MFWRMPGAQQWQSIVVAAEAIILGLATGLASVGVGLAGERYGHIYLGGIALSFWGLFAYAERFGYDRAFWTALAMLCLLTVSLVFHQEMQYR